MKPQDIILKNLSDVVFCFDRDGVVQSGYSAVCENYFGKDFQNKKVWRAIFYAKDQRNIFKEWVDFAFEGYMNFEDSSGLAPKRCVIYSGAKKDYVNMSILYTPIYDSCAKLIYIMVQIIDKSRESELCRVLEQKFARNDLVMRILKNKDSYVSFLNEANACLVRLSNTILAMTEDNLEVLINEAFRPAHTLKGNSATYGIINVRNEAHELESLLNQARKENNCNRTSFDVFIRSLRTRFASLKTAFRDHIVDMEVTFKERFDPNKSDGGSYRITEKDLQVLLEYCNRALEFNTNEEKQKAELDRLKNYIIDLRLIPVEIFLNPYKELVARLAPELGKRVKNFDIIGGHIRIDRVRFESFFSNFTHLVRNAVDHGLEEPLVRESKGKELGGSLTIEVEEFVSGELRVSMSDDGDGIDPEHVANIAIKKGVITYKQAQELSAEGKQLLIFAPGFSTKETVSSTSGRGVGMDAVKTEVERLGGTIQVSSYIGKGSRFVMTLPKYNHLQKQDPLSIGNSEVRVKRDPLFIQPTAFNILSENIGRVINLSRDGFMLTGPYEYAIKDHQQFTLSLSSDFNVTVFAEVRWCRANSKYFDVGLQILSVVGDHGDHQLSELIRMTTL